jgi:hypothetical protein|tara:strand:+ start:515 stop:883 length:369 start_codon:yes stop_codon:yes gene_type:complete
MKAFAIALAAGAAALSAAPAFAGPYVKTKHEFVGVDDDYSKGTHQVRVGYGEKLGRFTPYVEGGVGRAYSDNTGAEEDFSVIQVGTGVKITDSLSGYGKWINTFKENDTRSWKVEFGTKYSF